MIRFSRIQAVNHVQLETCSGIEERLRWFYEEVGELEPVPSNMIAAEFFCFRSRHLELRFRVVEAPDVDGVAVRVTLVIRNLAAAARMLDERQVPHEWIHGAMFTDRVLMVQDPVGHRVVLRQEWPVGPF